MFGKREIFRDSMALWSARRLGVACVEFTHDSVNRTFGTRESMEDYVDAEGLGRGFRCDISI